MTDDEFTDDDEAGKLWQGFEDVAEMLDVLERFAARFAPGPRFEVIWKIDAPIGGRVADLTFTIEESGTVITDNLDGQQLPAQTLRELNARKRQN